MKNEPYIIGVEGLIAPIKPQTDFVLLINMLW